MKQILTGTGLVTILLLTVNACWNDTAEVPDVIGLAPDQAESEINDAGYEVDLEEIIDPNVEEARVTEQTPDAETGLEEGEFVAIRVVVPPPPVPDVIGLSQADAEAWLSEEGYEVQVSEEYEDGAELGEVLEQRPSAGSSHDPERPVQITVAGEFLSPDVKGIFVLLGDADSVESTGSGCQGTRGYDDIHSGAQVVVRDESGTVLATTSLGNGTLLETGMCYFEFHVGSLPRAQFYSFEVSRRGELTYSRSELEQNDWTFEASLGSQ